MELYCLRSRSGRRTSYLLTEIIRRKKRNNCDYTDRNLFFYHIFFQNIMYIS